MMVITDLWKYYGDQPILRGISAQIGPADRIGLVGANGAGKTTLLKTLAGVLFSDAGQVNLRGGFTQGYLGQADYRRDQSLESFLQELFGRQIKLEEQLRFLELEMSVLQPGSALDKAMADYSRVQAEFEHGGSYDYLVRINGVITGLGFGEADLPRKLGSFSGGEQMRIGLARLLLSSPSLLILDEPTNHLDLQSVEWLEGFLGGYSSAFIVVSHDRLFLDRVASRIWELEEGGLHQYRGNYSEYLSQRRLRHAQQEAKLEHQQQKRSQMEAFIRKFGAGTRARQAKSLEKRLNRLPQLDAPQSDPSFVFRFEPRRRSGLDVLFMENVCKAFGAEQILSGLNARVKRGERIALLGKNGSGKSTLLKILQGELKYEGAIRWGTGVEKAYFSQQISFTPGNTVLEELYAEHRLDLGILRSVLARFLLKGDDVFKQTSVLSGGERNRLALAKLLLHRPNLLLLDEPTNHLDVYAREALEEALTEFGGTIIFATHDRYLIDKLATRIWFLEGGSLRQIVGNFTRFEEIRREEKMSRSAPEARRSEINGQRRKGKKKARLEGQRRQVEEEIFGLEAQKKELEQKMMLPEFYEDESKSAAVVREYREIAEELQHRYEVWEELVDGEEEGGG